MDYHRRITLSLLCSKWEEVVHVVLNHREIGGIMSRFKINF